MSNYKKNLILLVDIILPITKKNLYLFSYQTNEKLSPYFQIYLYPTF